MRHANAVVIALWCWAVSASVQYATAIWLDPKGVKYLDIPPSMFAPGGRLFSVELMAQLGLANVPCNNLVAAAHCQDGVVVVSSLSESPYLSRNLTRSDGHAAENENDQTFTPLTVPETGVARPPFLRLSNKIWAVTAGNSVHSQLLRLKLHRLAESIREEDQGDRPDVLARRLADNMQTLTQQDGHGGILAAHAAIFTSSEIWRVDPTGQFWKCRATVIGRDCFAAEAALLSELTDTPERDVQEKIADMSKDEALALLTKSMTANKRAAPSDEQESSLSETLKGFWLSEKPRWFSHEELKAFAQQPTTRATT